MVHSFHAYNPYLIVLSLSIGILTSCSSLEWRGRVAMAAGLANLRRKAAGAFLLGSGLWSMQFLAALALTGDSGATFRPGPSLLALAISVIASLIPFSLLKRAAAGSLAPPAGALLFAGGQLAMLGFGIRSIRLPAPVVPGAGWWIAAGAVALIASFFLFLLFRRGSPPPRLSQRLIVAGLSGILLFLPDIILLHALQGSPAFSLKRDAVPADAARMALAALSAIFGGLILAASVVSSAERRAVRRELLRINQRTELILNSSDEGIIGIDSEGRTTFGNSSAVKLLGFSLEEWTEHIPYRRFYHMKPDGRLIGPESCPIRQSLELGIVQHFSDETFVRKDGRMLPVEFVCTPLTEFNTITGALLTFRDKTQQLRTEEELTRSEAKYRALVETAGDAILILDGETRILSWNHGAQMMFGYVEQETVGKKLSHLIWPDCRDMYLKWIGAHRYDGATAKVGSTIELTGIKKSGGLFPLELSVHTYTSHDNQFYSAIIRDVTERKLAEEELRIREERYRQLVESSPDAIIIVNQGRILYANETGCTLLGPRTGELIGTRADQWFDPASASRLHDYLRAAAAGGNPDWFEDVIVRSDGTSRDVEVKALYTVYREGPSVHLILRDISERKKAQELFQNSEKLAVLGQLAAGVAHEIRNPLTSIKGFIQLMQIRDSGDYDNYFSIILSELDRINFIVSEFLLLSKPQLVEFRRHDITALLEDVITLFRTQAIMNQTEITFYCEKSPVYVRGVENHLKQVFINVLKNALDAMPDGGEIHIRIECGEDDSVWVHCIDQGFGIDRERIPQLGEPFYTTKDKGTGLGLMVSFKIIKDHGGSIHIDSALGVGTTVSVQLPLDLVTAGRDPGET